MQAKASANDSRYQSRGRCLQVGTRQVTGYRNWEKKGKTESKSDIKDQMGKEKQLVTCVGQQR